MKQFDDISNQQSDDFVRQKISHHRFFYAECRFFLEFIASLSAIVSTSFDQIELIQIKVSCGLLESWAVIYVCISKIGILCAKPHSFFLWPHTPNHVYTDQFRNWPWFEYFFGVSYDFSVWLVFFFFHFHRIYAYQNVLRLPLSKVKKWQTKWKWVHYNGPLINLL